MGRPDQLHHAAKGLCLEDPAHAGRDFRRRVAHVGNQPFQHRLVERHQLCNGIGRPLAVGRIGVVERRSATFPSRDGRRERDRL